MNPLSEDYFFHLNLWYHIYPNKSAKLDNTGQTVHQDKLGVVYFNCSDGLKKIFWDWREVCCYFSTWLENWQKKHI